MAKTKSAEPSAPTTILADQIKKCRQGLIDDCDKLHVANPDEIDALTTALMYFQNYPILKETLVDSVRQRSNGEHQILQGLAVLQQQLNFTHEAAVMFLIQKCESMGIDSAAISMSGDYCRVLLNDRQHNFGAYRDERGVDTWPDCLSVDVLEIPADIREAVQAAKASLLKLVARSASNVSPATVAHSSTDVVFSSYREPQEWLRLRKLKGLSHGKNAWRGLCEKHSTDIECESIRSARISMSLARSWGFDLPEFRK